MISLFDDFLQWFVLWNEIVAVTMQAQKEAPPDFQCKDKFLLLSVVAPDGATAKDIGPDMVGPLPLFFFFFFKVKFCVKSFLDSDGVWIWLQFTKEDGKVVEEFKLRVVYIPANPPSPVPEGSEEGSSPRAFSQENGNHHNSSFDDVRVS